MCACAVRREPSLYSLFLRIRLDTTPVLVMAITIMLERWVLEEKLQSCLLCEHIAIPVILIFLFPVLLNNKILSIRIACYVRTSTTVLKLSVVLEDMFPTMLIEFITPL